MKDPGQDSGPNPGITLSLGMCFGAGIGILYEPIGIAMRAGYGLMAGIFIPMIFSSKTNTDDKISDMPET